jgi:TFIIF-interacting CTD phosphatase-like protein
MNVDLVTMGDTPNASTRVCYNCQKPGHIKANCQSPRVPRANTTQTQEATTCKMCGYCSKPGHDAKECYSLKREKARLAQSQTSSKAQARVTETSSDAGTEQILLTKDNLRDNFKDMMMSLPDKERATVVEEMLSQDFSGETN